MIRRPPRSTLSSSSAASDVYKRQVQFTRERSRPRAGYVEQAGRLRRSQRNPRRDRSVTPRDKLTSYPLRLRDSVGRDHACVRHVVRQGKALYIGVSEWTAEQLRAGHALAGELGIHLISNQPQYSMLWRVIESEVVPACEDLGISQIVWSPVAQGVLTGKYEPGQAPPEGTRARDAKGGADMIARWMSDEVLTGVQRLRPIADEIGLTMAQLAIAWVLQNPNIAAAIIGASRPEQVVANVKASAVTLDADVLTAIDDAVGSLAERDPALTTSPETREA